MYTVNQEFYGHLINPDQYNIKLTRPDFYMLLTNRPDWEQRYIHPEYIEQLKPNFTFNQPCPDVYWIPIGTEQFCDDLVAIMEGYGKWSDGSNNVCVLFQLFLSILLIKTINLGYKATKWIRSGANT